ncbi:hypothetical protein H2204_011660 [Knufia peltigerae]|uniref:Uncharacterized protein n=1 Tax=Knufia peltigerae TaxID=1002370 RepID=A0AA38XTZ0_9EURO|nr:hypothetical protein H2204_011660 [Knufia peltigerae]
MATDPPTGARLNHLVSGRPLTISIEVEDKPHGSELRIHDPEPPVVKNASSGDQVSPGMHQYVSAMIDDDIDMSGPQSGGRNRWKMPKTSRSPIKTDDVPERAKFYSSHSANK